MYNIAFSSKIFYKELGTKRRGVLLNIGTHKQRWDDERVDNYKLFLWITITKELIIEMNQTILYYNLSNSCLPVI